MSSSGGQSGGNGHHTHISSKSAGQLHQQMTALSKRLSDSVARADEESNCESWVELDQPSRNSLSSSIDALYIPPHDAQLLRERHGSRQSPKSLSSPNTEFVSLDPTTKQKLWDWSSRVEVIPPKEYRYRFVSRSALTTPPNSPQPELDVGWFSLRHSSIVKSQLFRVEVIFGLVVSNFVTFLLGACLGYALCKRIHHKY